MTISRVENACKPLILLGLQKNIKIISTQHLMWLTINAIVQLEQGKKKRFENPLFAKINTPDISPEVLYNIDQKHEWN